MSILYAFHRDLVEADRMKLIADGNEDGFMAAEVSARIFAAAPHIVVAVCDVQRFPERSPPRLVVVMPGVWVASMKPNAPAVADALRDLRDTAAVEILPANVVS